MHATMFRKCALCAALGATLLAGCSKSTIDPARYGQTGGANGQYAQPAAPVQSSSAPMQETTLTEAPLAPAPAASTPVASVPLVSTPMAAEPVPAPAYTPVHSPAASHDGPFAPSAEEELESLRSSPPASAPAPAPAQTVAPAPPRPAAAASGGVVYQLHAFKDQARAKATRDQLAAKGHDVFTEEVMVSGQSYTRILLRLHGTDAEQRGVLNSLGVPDARVRRDAPAAVPAPVPSAVPAAKPAPQPASLPAAKPAPAALPVVTPPAQPIAAPAPAPVSSAPKSAKSTGCQVSATHIQASGVGLPGAGSPLMIEKQAREDATRNLLTCVETYRKERGQIPQDYSMPTDIPPGLLQVGDVDLQADGSVHAIMRIRLADLAQLDVQILD